MLKSLRERLRRALIWAVLVIDATPGENVIIQIDQCTVGPAGHIGATLLQQMITKTENAISKNDLVQMIKCYEELKETA